jgi:hypothetical protein
MGATFSRPSVLFLTIIHVCNFRLGLILTPPNVVTFTTLLKGGILSHS